MFYKLLFFVCLWTVCFGQELLVGDACKSDGVEGVCKVALQCDPAVKSIKKQDFHTFKRCGFLGLEEIVCCIEDGFGDRTAHPTTAHAPVRPPAQAFKPAKKETPVNTLRKADRECERIKELVSPPLGDYIIGGADAATGEFPHMAAVAYIKEEKNAEKNAEKKALEFLCGGTLVSERFVMSAAHCFRLKSLGGRKPVLVRVGVTSLSGNSYNPDTDYNISRIVMHPKFNKHSFDIALLELDRPVPVKDTVHPGCLYTRQELPSHAVVTGWGIIDFTTRDYSESLQKVNLTVVANARCVEQYKTLNQPQLIEENMLCAGEESGKDACQGDSGGPLQALTEKDGHYRIIGLVSFGVLCGTKMPGVYTRVSSHLDWIESVVWP